MTLVDISAKFLYIKLYVYKKIPQCQTAFRNNLESYSQ